MLARIWVMSLAIISFGAAALAHSGATGIVKERMDGMSAMGRVVKELTPMMRGQSTYDAERVRVAADVMIMHAGEQMTEVFPEGSGGNPSAALPAVWEDWEEFSALALQLESYAEGMKRGAENGLAEEQSDTDTAAMMGADQGATMGGGMMGTLEPMTADVIAALPTDAAFAAVAQTCSACHQKFRAKED